MSKIKVKRYRFDSDPNYSNLVTSDGKYVVWLGLWRWEIRHMRDDELKYGCHLALSDRLVKKAVKKLNLEIINEPQ